ncbi:hypothetical protein HYALB_00002086 [Hymenoscyphus albidus]|uniref:Clr5 domain-containing protein n=1 Tax=Hymenoscyphus albidus TaxID=595503 RepID=A0A9N9LF56_9HELO|nr:hypothetical protein HYALB_00002086 [Hymenoscyphus albidus]
MPKDWLRHKAAIARLYIDEGRTLKEVQEILHQQYGFQASTRAYRMRIDEWALRKYKPREDFPEAEESFTVPPKTSPDMKVGSIVTPLPPDALSNFQIMPTGLVPMPPSIFQPKPTTDLNHVLQPASHNTIPPEGPMTSTEMLAFIEDLPQNPQALEHLLTKWQAGGSYVRVLRLLLKTPSYCEWTFCPQTRRPQLFKLMEIYVPPNEQLEVGKLLLNSLCLTGRTRNSQAPTWLILWNNACHCNDWEGVQNLLYDNASQDAGELFVTAALVVCAERILQQIHKRLRALAMPEALNNECQRFEADQLRQNYLNILEGCRDKNLDLRPSLYKQSLEVIERDEFDDDDQRTLRRLTLADECRHKYLLMTNDEPMDCHNGFDENAGDIVEKGWTEEANIIVLNNEHFVEPIPSIESDSPSPDFSPLPHDFWIQTAPQSLPTPAADPISSAQTIVADLMERFKYLRGFKLQVRSILIGNHWEFFFFDRKSQSPPQENLFDEIVQYIPEFEQISLMKAILLACSTISPRQIEPALSWFLQTAHSKKWADFRDLVQQAYVDKYLAPNMSSQAVKQVVDSMTLLVGERMLKDLKILLMKNPGSKARGKEMESYKSTNKTYMAILMEFRSRGLDFDQSWLSFALDTM